MPIRRLLTRLAAGLAPYWRGALLIALGLLLETGFHSLVPFSFKFIVDDGLVRGDHSLLLSIVAGLAAGALVVSVTGLARDYLYARVASRILADKRRRLFSHLQRLSMNFYARARSGDILSRFSSDLASIETALANALPWGVLPGLDVLLNTVLLFVLDWRLALMAMLVWPMCLLGPRVFARRAVWASYSRKRVEGETLSELQENITSQPILKALNLRAFSQQRFDGHNERLFESILRVGFFSALVERSAGIGIMLLQVAVLGAGAWMAAEGQISVGTLMAFQALFMSLSFSLSYTTQYIPTLVQASGALLRIDELLLEVPEVADAPDATPLPPLTREIVFDSVTFGYAPGSTDLQQISLSIPAGAAVAFVGASGSGKSTLLNLLMRLYDPRSGAIRFDGRDLRSTTQASARDQMGVVFQDSYLLNTSIAENIRMGKQDATQAQIEDAARAAEIHDFIAALPQGYQTMAGEQGGQLSGGQRQRIAIARALVRDPRVLLLDEVTSALDPGTEAAVNDTLLRVGKNRTTIYVTHRLATVTGADCIYVLDHGALVEHGTHDALLARNGHYRRLWDKQSGFSLNAEGDHATITAARVHTLPVLDQLDDALLAEAAHLFVTEQYAAGRTVVQEGDRRGRYYIIVRGSVELLTAVGGGELRRVGVLEDGDSFGEGTMLNKVPQYATVRTLTGCTFLSLQGEHFEYLLARAPQLRERLENLHVRRVAAQAFP